ncbi:MAG: carbohydrate binding family 9 domain-containing protein [Gemmatimonadota bacterium]|nr:MAG: carbohydrate binding family 9 domain-containing protein [Gemmatimonadota bacterium]
MTKTLLFSLGLGLTLADGVIAQEQSIELDVAEGVASQASRSRPSHTAVAATSRLDIDGVLDETAWLTAAWSGGFTQREPVSGDAPSEPTRFAVLYDPGHLYVGVRAADSRAGRIARPMNRRDDLGESDHVVVYVDSYHDRRSAFAFAVTASGVRADGYCPDDQPECDLSWDPVWAAGAAVGDSGWTAEFKIPLDQLRYVEAEEQVWGLQVGRFLFRNGEWSLWAPAPSDAQGWASRFGELQGLSLAAGGWGIELQPYAVARLLPPAERAIGSDVAVTAGLDAKAVLRGNYTLAVTINPDFGQVEADPSEVNLSAFETRFEERRPFFLEGSDILQFALPASSALGDTELFYSRRIGRPLLVGVPLQDGELASLPARTIIRGAARLTGRTRGGLAVGLLDAVTGPERVTVLSTGGARREAPVEPLTNHLVARALQNYNEGDSRIGAMVTAVNRQLDPGLRAFLGSAAYAVGLEAFHWWGSRTYFVGATVAGSRIEGDPAAMLRAQMSSSRYFQRPDAAHVDLNPARTSLSGHGGSVTLGKGGNANLLYNLRLNWRSPGFELNDLGFTRLADAVQEKIWIGYDFNRPVGAFRHLAFATEHLGRWSFGGENLLNEVYVQAEAQLRSFWVAWARFYVRDGALSTTATRGGPALRYEPSTEIRYRLHSDERQALRLGLWGRSAWRHDRGSQSHSLGLEMTWRATHTVSLALTSELAHDLADAQWVTRAEVAGDPRYVFGRLNWTEVRATIRIEFVPMPELSVQFYGQPFAGAGSYSSFKRVDDPRADAYGDRFHTFGPDEIDLSEDGNYYTVTEPDGSYEFARPDLNSREFRSNLVIRWEYLPGSTLFLVWHQTRDSFGQSGAFDLSREWDALFGTTPVNLFLVKASYRLSI